MSLTNNSIERLTALSDMVQNIRSVRTKLLGKSLTQELFNEINGSDAALETLLGDTVLFGMLNEQEILGLRCKIMDKLNENEVDALKELKDTVSKMLTINNVKQVDATMPKIKIDDEKFGTIALDNAVAYSSAMETIGMAQELTAELEDIVNLTAELQMDSTEEAFPDEQKTEKERSEENLKALEDRVSQLACPVPFQHNGLVKELGWDPENLRKTRDLSAMVCKDLNGVLDCLKGIIKVEDLSDDDAVKVNKRFANCMSQINSVVNGVNNRLEMLGATLQGIANQLV